MPPLLKLSYAISTYYTMVFMLRQINMHDQLISLLNCKLSSKYLLNVIRI